MRRPRIVSLVPSATEIVCGLGLADTLVGRSHVCNHPPSVLERPVLTRARLASDSSRGIHDEVRQRLSDGLAIFEVDLEALRALAPTHLLVQDQCAVCAVSPTDLEAALGDWLGGEPPMLVRLAPHQLADVWTDIATIGEALDAGAAARTLRHTLSFRLSDLAEAIGSAGVQPRVACLEWLDPLMIAGHWVPELVRIAGGEPILAATGGPSRTVDLERLRRAAPDVIVVQACGFDLPRTRAAWRSQPGLADSFRGWVDSAGRRIRVALVDGDAYFNRPGPRLVESAELLAEILHPAYARPGRGPREDRARDPADDERGWIWASD